MSKIREEITIQGVPHGVIDAGVKLVTDLHDRNVTHVGSVIFFLTKVQGAGVYHDHFLFRRGVVNLKHPHKPSYLQKIAHKTTPASQASRNSNRQIVSNNLNDFCFEEIPSRLTVPHIKVPL